MCRNVDRRLCRGGALLEKWEEYTGLATPLLLRLQTLQGETAALMTPTDPTRDPNQDQTQDQTQDPPTDPTQGRVRALIQRAEVRRTCVHHHKPFQNRATSDITRGSVHPES